MKIRFRAWLMRTFGLVDRNLYHDTLQGLIEANNQTIQANYRAMEYGERLDAAYAEIRQLKASRWPVALRDALRIVEKLEDTNAAQN